MDATNLFKDWNPHFEEPENFSTFEYRQSSKGGIALLNLLDTI